MDQEYGPTQPEAVYALIKTWVRTNAEKIFRIWGLGWGWEAWLQADLADSLQQGTGLRLHRETRIYQENEHWRMDLTMWDDQGDILHYFEFKCKSEAGTTDAFFQGLQDDWEKVRSNLAINSTAPRAWAVGIFVDQATERMSGHTNWNVKKYGPIWLLARTEPTR